VFDKPIDLEAQKYGMMYRSANPLLHTGSTGVKNKTELDKPNRGLCAAQRREYKRCVHSSKAVTKVFKMDKKWFHSSVF